MAGIVINDDFMREFLYNGVIMERHERDRLKNPITPAVIELGGIEAEVLSEPLLLPHLNTLAIPLPPQNVLSQTDVQYFFARLNISTRLKTEYLGGFYLLQQSGSISHQERKKSIQEQFKEHAKSFELGEFLLVHGRTPELTNYMRAFDSKRSSRRFDCPSLKYLSFILYERTNESEFGFSTQKTSRFISEYKNFFGKFIDAIK